MHPARPDHPLQHAHKPHLNALRTHLQNPTLKVLPLPQLHEHHFDRQLDEDVGGLPQYHVVSVVDAFYGDAEAGCADFHEVFLVEFQEGGLLDVRGLAGGDRDLLG